ncbi:MAG: fimbrial chaperone protein [Sphingomonadales bacterium]|nr:fimbrial chaperone protein [Sphingomonadales bacterium]
MVRKPAENRQCARPIRARVALALLAAGLSAGTPANASSFQVDPVNLTMAAGQRRASLTIKNSDADPVAVRVFAYRWTQKDGVDVYSETEDIIASPPIFTISPGAMQLVRLGLRGPSRGNAYRIFLEEIPRQRPDNSQIQMTLRLNLPLYLLPEKGGKPELSWRVWRDAAGDLFIAATNGGPVQAQVLEIAAADEGGGTKVLSRELGVVLPGSVRHWNAGKAAGFGAGSVMRLKIRDAVGETAASIVVERR